MSLPCWRFTSCQTITIHLYLNTWTTKRENYFINHQLKNYLPVWYYKNTLWFMHWAYIILDLILCHIMETHSTSWFYPHVLKNNRIADLLIQALNIYMWVKTNHIKYPSLESSDSQTIRYRSLHHKVVCTWYLEQHLTCCVPTYQTRPSILNKH